MSLEPFIFVPLILQMLIQVIGGENCPSSSDDSHLHHSLCLCVYFLNFIFSGIIRKEKAMGCKSVILPFPLCCLIHANCV